MDGVQDLIDRKIAQFILTGSSARKLRHGSHVNLLPGRVHLFKLDPFLVQECPPPHLESALYYRSLPSVAALNDNELKDHELRSYVSVYLEQEVRAESLVRNLGAFSRFLELAAIGENREFQKDIARCRRGAYHHCRLLSNPRRLFDRRKDRTHY